MAILVGQTWNLGILHHGNFPKIKMADIWPIFEVGTQKLVYDPKLYMFLGICGKLFQKSLLRPKKRCMTNVPPPRTSELAQTSVYGGFPVVPFKNLPLTIFEPLLGWEDYRHDYTSRHPPPFWNWLHISQHFQPTWNFETASFRYKTSTRKNAWMWKCSPI